MLFADDLSATWVTIQGADASFAELFQERRDGVYRFAWFLCGNESVAEEVTAEVFARVLPKWRRGGVSEPAAYLRRAVLNEVRSRHRRKGHEQRALARHRTRDLLVEDADRLSIREPLVAALQKLPIKQRAVVVLRFLDDLSEADVARLVGSPVGTVKAQTSRGLATLRTLLEPQ
jgi:RNA polymerase sigma-70 factor (sigma-E family)